MSPKSPILPSAESEPNAFPTEAVPTPSDSLHRALAEQRDLNLRLAAEFENFRRRNRQEGETRAAAQKESFIHELLPAIDNLERALASGSSPGSPQLHQGVEMTLQQLHTLLAQHGFETEGSLGQPFDPHKHEAVFQRHDPTQPADAILEVLQRGYRQDTKVFRPAKVVVNAPTVLPEGPDVR